MKAAHEIPWIRITVNGRDEWSFAETSDFMRWLDEAVAFVQQPEGRTSPGPFSGMGPVSYKNGKSVA